MVLKEVGIMSWVLVNRHCYVRYITVLICESVLHSKHKRRKRLDKRHAYTTKKSEISKRTVKINAHSNDINSCCWADTSLGNILVSASNNIFGIANSNENLINLLLMSCNWLAKMTISKLLLCSKT